MVVSHYRVEEEIGRGGMGVVYRAVDSSLGRRAPIKLLPPDATGDSEDSGAARERKGRLHREVAIDPSHTTCTRKCSARCMKPPQKVSLYGDITSDSPARDHHGRGLGRSGMPERSVRTTTFANRANRPRTRVVDYWSDSPPATC